MRLYVGNIPYSATEDELREHFEQMGVVQRIEMPRVAETQQPRGFGFIDMTENDALRAIENLNGEEFGGRRLTVNEARERVPVRHYPGIRQGRPRWS